MNYAAHRPATYLVSWPDDLIVKAGFTTRQRWRKFLLRGAELHDVVFFDGAEAVWVESAAERVLHERLARAFEHRTEAVDHLGGRGAGWLECYRAPDREALDDALAECLSIMHAHCVSTCHGRTDGRTDADALTVRVNLTDRNARRGAPGFAHVSVDSNSAPKPPLRELAERVAPATGDE